MIYTSFNVFNITKLIVDSMENMQLFCNNFNNNLSEK